MQRVAFICKCTSPAMYCCDIHLADHMKTPGDHHTECVVVKLSRNQTRELFPKLKELIKYLNKR